MKKTILAVFSVSITAGTLYLAYSQGKSYYIKKLVQLWVEETNKRNTKLTNEQLTDLPIQLDKLNLLYIKQLFTFTEKIITHAPPAELTILLKKLINKKIMEKADLHAVDTILFGEKQITKPTKL